MITALVISIAINALLIGFIYISRSKNVNAGLIKERNGLLKDLSKSVVKTEKIEDEINKVKRNINAIKQTKYDTADDAISDFNQLFPGD